jgi:hypothetical protein
VTLSDIFGSADLGESLMNFCYSRQVAMILEEKSGMRMDRNSRQVMILEEKIGMRMDRKWLPLLLRREAVLRKIRLQGEDVVVVRDFGMYIVSTHKGLVRKL